MKDLYKHAPEAPFHISVGAVVVNAKGDILVHRMLKENMPQMDVFKLGDLQELYILMRESLENGETLEEGVQRGIKEEFGAEGEIKKYLGSIQIPIPAQYEWEKTTLYFEVSLTKEGERSADDGEAHSELVWMDPHELIKKMQYQAVHSERGDIDESKIVEAYVTHR